MRIRIICAIGATVAALLLQDFTLVRANGDGNSGPEERTYLKKDGTHWWRVVRRGHTIVSREPTEAPRDKVDTTVGFAEPPGYLRPYVTYPVGSMPEAVAIGDLNHDGLNDVALITSFYFDPENDATLFVFLQSGAGVLQTPVRYPVGGDPSSVDVGDVNGDGRDDVVVGRGDGIFVLLQNAGGRLDDGVNYQTPSSEKIQIGDFNSDGLKDVAGIDWGAQHQIVIYTQQMGGALALAATYNGTQAGYNDLEVGDLNADGRDDLIVMSGQSYASPNVSVLLQQPGGLFNTAAIYDLGGDELTHGVGVGDVDGDARSDLAASYGGNGPDAHVAVWFQNPIGTLDQPAAKFPSYDIPQAIEVADITLDGRPDLIVTHGGWLRLGVYRQESDGSLATEDLFPIPYSTSSNPHSLAVGDINGDGAADAVVADYNEGLVVLLQNVAGVKGTGVSRNEVAVTWSSFPGATSYEVYRRTFGESFSMIGTSLGNSFSDSTVAAETSYLYRIRALYPDGHATLSAYDIATTLPFTDDPLVPETTTIKAIHLTELRTAVNAVRALAGLAHISFTYDVTVGALIRTSDIKELRLALDPALDPLGFGPAPYGEAIIVRGIVRASHFEEIRARVR